MLGQITPLILTGNEAPNIGRTPFGKTLLFGGRRGWYYVFQRTLAETLLALRLLEARLERSPKLIS